MSETIGEFSFPGMDLFDKKQAEELSRLIQDTSGSQSQMVIQTCENQGIGWLPSGFPDHNGVARVERAVRIRGCASIALEAAKTMDADLSSEAMLDLVEECSYLYENIPQAVFKHLQSR